MTADIGQPGADDVVLAIDVGGTLVKTAVVGRDAIEVERLATMTPDQPWGIDRLCAIADDLHTRALGAGQVPVILSVVVPGQVDDYHGVVQYSANLPWHDVAVADELRKVVPCEVVVRHDVRAAALAEANLGAGVDAAGLFFVAIGTGIGAAGVQSGMVVADHAGAGEIGQIRIRSGPGVGRRLEEFASASAIATRYAQRVGREPGHFSAEQVHELLGDDADARAVWDEAVEALADALEWSVALFNPERIVIGGGLVNAGADLLEPLAAGLARRVAPRDAPAMKPAHFGADAGWVGAVLIGWKQLGWPPDDLGDALDRYAVTRGSPGP